MTAEIIKFPKQFKETFTDEFVPVNNVLKGADKEDLEDCLVIGVRKEDGEFYFASASSSTGRVIFLLEKAKKVLLEQI